MEETIQQQAVELPAIKISLSKTTPEGMVMSNLELNIKGNNLDECANAINFLMEKRQELLLWVEEKNAQRNNL